MYKIIKGGSVIGMTERPAYIKLHENGCYVLCDESEATGISVNSTPYALSDGSLGACETVQIIEVDGAAMILRQNAMMDELILSALEVK